MVKPAAPAKSVVKAPEPAPKPAPEKEPVRLEKEPVREKAAPRGTPAGASRPDSEWAEPALASKSNGAHPPEKAPVVEETGGFDLAAELGDIFEEIEEEEEAAPAFDENEQVSVGDVLREFRKGVEKQIGTEDKDARYNLGIAYREMGLLDEAIGEFQIASEDTARRPDCLSMIGICQRDKGDLDAAIQSFSGALKTPGLNEKQKASFFYELATTLEMSGETAKAQKAFQQVQALDPGFRDVADKLGGGGGGGSGAAMPNKKISFI
jgi:tetratricopeptide (TPR) repeat protein